MQLICPLLSGPKSGLDLVTKEARNGEEAQPEEIIGKLREAEIVLAQEGRWRAPAAGSVLRSRATTAGARNMAV